MKNKTQVHLIEMTAALLMYPSLIKINAPWWMFLIVLICSILNEVAVRMKLDKEY